MVPKPGCDEFIDQTEGNAMFSTLSSQPEAHPLQPPGKLLQQQHKDKGTPQIQGRQEPKRLQGIGEGPEPRPGTAGKEGAEPWAGLDEQMDTRGCGH